ncbi:MAG: hypothetical protein IKW67_03580 [Alphaproteobacteria bacterium]|nr:hypothetical protein [Alphaproteobacteria bacterium]
MKKVFFASWVFNLIFCFSAFSYNCSSRYVPGNYEDLKNANTPALITAFIEFFDAEEGVPCQVLEDEFSRRMKDGWKNPRQIENLLKLKEYNSYVSDKFDDFVYSFYDYKCNIKDGQEIVDPKMNFINKCLIENQCGFNVDDGVVYSALRQLLDGTAIGYKSLEYYLCVLKTVADYDTDSQKKIDLINYGLERAKKYNNHDFEYLINGLLREIEKISSVNNE